MSNFFFERPILNSPYDYPALHWELNSAGQPTQQIIDTRRGVSFITPIPSPKKKKRADEQRQLIFDEGHGLSTNLQQYDPTSIINEVRHYVDQWRKLPSPSDWNVTPETVRLLKHWRHHKFNSFRPFFCQIEAVEVAIWLTEVAPKVSAGKKFLEHLVNANNDANPELIRLALKLATGAGKTTVMAMLIAWQTLNTVKQQNSKKFTRGFLIVAPGLTIKDRLRVLHPHDPDSYYLSRELVPQDMLRDLDKAKIVITNYHAFKLREKMDLSKGGRMLLQGRGGDELNTLETEGQMIQRVMPELMGLKNILVINDEAHHCYREKPLTEEEKELKGDEKKEAEKNREAARMWITGLETVKRKLGVTQIVDLSATPFFLRGSGYAEGTLFPWTMSDFSLMDAIECGIVKLPRVPIADNIPGNEMPMFRNLWDHIGKKMPKKGRGNAGVLDPLDLPPQLQTALEALQVKAMRPERDELEIRFPRVQGYRVELPDERLTAAFNDDSTLELTPDLVGATETRQSGIIGATADLNLVHTGDIRPSQVLYELTSHLVLTKWRDENGEPQLPLFGQLKRISKQWLDDHLVCNGGTYPAQLKYKMLADMACERITAAITRAHVGGNMIKAMIDPYNPVGSTMHVNFTTSKRDRWETDSRKCHVNWVILDSDWESEFCRVAEGHPKVRAYVKNHNLGLEVPYRYGSETRTYIPDFIVRIDDGHGEENLLNLIVEIKGYRREDAKEKKSTMETYWVPGVNNLETHGRWAFAEFTEVYQIESDFEAKVETEFNKMIDEFYPAGLGRD